MKDCGAAGEEYAYEVLNFADGKRNAQEIRDAVSAEYGPVPLETGGRVFEGVGEDRDRVGGEVNGSRGAARCATTTSVTGC